MAHSSNDSSGAEQLLPQSSASTAGTDVTAMCIGAGDATATDGLVERHYAVVYRYAYRLCGCGWAAEDIAQETFVRAIKHWQQLRVAEAERGWILSIARREFMRWLRHKSHPTYGHSLTGGDDAVAEQWQSLPDQSSSAEGAPRVEQQDWVERSLAELGNDARVVLVMYYFEELSYAEIARQLEIPIGTVMSRLSRGREQMRVALERSEERSPSRVASRSDAATSLPASLLGTNLHGKPLAQEARHD